MTNRRSPFQLRIRPRPLGFALLTVWLFLAAIVAAPACAETEAWRKTSLPVGDVYALASDPRNSQIILAGSWGQGVYRSTDGGESWQVFNNGLPNFLVRALAVDAAGASYVGTYGNGVCRFVADGQEWKTVNTGLGSEYVYSLATDSTSNVYAGTAEGVFRLTRGGQSWTRQGLEGLSVLALAIPPSREQTLYAATWGGGVFRSDDSGTSWVQANEGLGNMYVRAVAVHPTNRNVVYAGTWGGGAYRTVDGGASWIEINTGLTARQLYALKVHISTEELVYAGTDGEGVSRFGDMLWVPDGLRGLKVRSLLTIGTGVAFKIYAGAADGVWVRQVAPSLTIHKESDPTGPVFLGDTITYTLRYTNTGGIKLTNVVINDFIPAGTTYVEGSADSSGGRYTPGLNLLEWRRDYLTAGVGGNVSFAVRLPPPPTPTATPSPTPTDTGTPTLTPTPPATPTDTETPTSTPTVSATITETVTVTPTITPTSVESLTATPTDTCTPTGTPPTATATPTVVCIDVLGNGNFETGKLDGWQHSGLTHIVTDIRRSGRYAVLLGGYDNAADELCQPITIPTDTISARLTYYWYVLTQQTIHPRDYLYLELWNIEGRFLANLDVISDGSPLGRWSRSSFDLLSYRGQSLRICFFCDTNDALPTYFYVDDVSLEICAPHAASYGQTYASAPARQAKQRSPLVAGLPPFVAGWQPATRAYGADDPIPVFNIALIFSEQTGWVRSNAAWNSPRMLALPLIIKP